LAKSVSAVVKRFALTIAAILSIIVDRHIALDAFGAPGALISALLRAFLAPFNFVHHLLFRLSIPLWRPAAPSWWDWLTTIASLAPYLLIDLILGAARADRAVTIRPD
jgi:hypothetical protein